MKRPPLWVTLSFQSHDESEYGSVHRWWIPLFIIVPLILGVLLALLLVVLPFLFVYFLISWDTRWWKYLKKGAPALFNALHATPGLKVDVEDGKGKTYIDIN